MNRLKQMSLAATRKAHPQSARAVPLMVPHGGADSSSDFESAFEMLQGDDRARELWHREPVKIPFGRAS
jgi:alpha-beta hydrolase superfamily lysophospholipase